MFQFIGDLQNDKLIAENITQTGGRFRMDGGWYDDSISVSNLIISGGTSYIHGDTEKDTV